MFTVQVIKRGVVVRKQEYNGNDLSAFNIALEGYRAVLAKVSGLPRDAIQLISNYRQYNHIRQYNQGGTVVTLGPGSGHCPVPGDGIDMATAILLLARRQQDRLIEEARIRAEGIARQAERDAARKRQLQALAPPTDDEIVAKAKATPAPEPRRVRIAKLAHRKLIAAKRLMAEADALKAVS